MSITVTKARSELFTLVEQVNADKAAVEITSPRGDAVLVAADEYNSLIETVYLLRSPANSARLESALKNVEDGNLQEHTIE